MLIEFQKELIDGYERLKSQQPSEIPVYLKIMFWFIVWVSTWWMAFGPVQFGIQIRLFFGVIHLCSHLFIALNLGHDANHGCLVEHEQLNSIFKRSFDLVGISSKLWSYGHNFTHHLFTSVAGKDEAANGKGVVRFTVDAKRRKIHRFQHLYAPILYSFVSINYVFVKDFKDVFHLIFVQKSLAKSYLIEFFIFKLFYVFYLLVAPVAFSHLSFTFVLFVFLLGHFVLGQLIIFIQIPHFNKEILTLRNKNDHYGKSGLQLDWIFKTTVDIAPQSRLVNWLFGGINNHVVHHIVPNVPHRYYIDLNKQMQQMIARKSFNYRSIDKFFQSYFSHYQYLKSMGSE